MNHTTSKVYMARNTECRWHAENQPMPNAGSIEQPALDGIENEFFWRFKSSKSPKLYSNFTVGQKIGINVPKRTEFLNVQSKLENLSML